MSPNAPPLHTAQISAKLAEIQRLIDIGDWISRVEAASMVLELNSNGVNLGQWFGKTVPDDEAIMIVAKTRASMSFAYGEIDKDMRQSLILAYKSGLNKLGTLDVYLHPMYVQAADQLREDLRYREQQSKFIYVQIYEQGMRSLHRTEEHLKEFLESTYLKPSSATHRQLVLKPTEEINYMIGWSRGVVVSDAELQRLLKDHG